VAATFFWPRATKAGAICGLLAGVIYNYGIVPKIIPPFGDIHAGIQGLVLNFVVLIIISLITKQMDKEHVYRFIV
jgi:SSS family solute:Na+ symporter